MGHRTSADSNNAIQENYHSIQFNQDYLILNKVENGNGNGNENKSGSQNRELAQDPRGDRVRREKERERKKDETNTTTHTHNNIMQFIHCDDNRWQYLELSIRTLKYNGTIYLSGK